MISLERLAGRRPSGTRQSSLLGPNGKPVSYFLYPSPRWNLRQYKPRFWLGADTKSNVSEYDRWELVNYSRQLFAQIGNLSTAVKQKNSWAFGDAWDPHYCGRNKKWGEEAEEFLKLQFYPNANVRGPQYDFKTSLTLSGKMWDVDGDDALVLTESANGFPQVAFFPSTRIGLSAMGPRGPMQRNNGEGSSVEGGKFDGARLFDGVILDKNNRMIGLRIASDDGTWSDISSFNADLAYLPDWHDQGRGIPRIATCLLRWMDIQDIDDFLRRGMKRAASVGLITKNEEGEAALGNEVVTEEEDASANAAGTGTTPVSGATPAQIAYEEVEGGEMYYLSSTTGEQIEALEYKNPHPNSEAYVERVVRECVASVGWLYELLDLTQTGRAPTRLACDIGNQSIWDQQRAGERRAKRAIVYAIAKAMKGGFLSKNSDGLDPYLWEFGLPKLLSVDAGNDEAADRENLKMGTTSKTLLAQKKGYHRTEILRQRTAEIEELIETAKAVTEKHPEVSFETAMALLEQRSPNPQPAEDPDEDPGPPAKKSQPRNT
jgi:hypothetical protein